jgi:Protein of unknown function (DUF3383)
MVSQNLSPANVIDVTLLGTPVGLAIPNINTIGLISQEVPVWSGVQDFAIYNNPTSVANDFGANSKAAAIANAIFSQNPNPILTQGYLVIITRKQNVPVSASLVIQNVNYTAVATGVGGNAITIAYTTGGVAGSEVVTVNSNAISVQIASGISTAAQIAAAVNASGAASALVTASVFSNSTKAQTAPVSATNLSGGSASGLEPVHTAMIRTATEVNYFGVILDFIPTAPFVNTPAYISGQSMMGFFGTNSKTDGQAGGWAANFAASAQQQCRGIYYNDGVAQDTVNFAAAYAARLLSVDFTGSLTSQTMNMKQLVGFIPDITLTQTDLNTFQTTGIDCYPALGFQGLVGSGRLFTSGANQFVDYVYGNFWLQLQIQVAGFDYLAQTNTKIPQTENGMDGLKHAYREVLDQAVVNGVAAPGEWNSPTFFGNPVNLENAIAAIGYYVYSQPISQQTEAQRAARIAPLIQIAVKLAGAIHFSNVIINVNA